jgi:tetratricopeptide (TPR) repeat protein
MSPALRVRLAVAAAAVAAAAIVVGVVLATRQDPAQPKAECKQAPRAFVVPGVGKPAAATGVRTAFTKKWPQGTIAAFESLATRFPGSPVVQFNYGLVLECRGYLGDAAQALQAAKQSGRDTIYEIDADQLLHPQYFQEGHPIFVPTGKNSLLVRGSVLQREGHQESAEKLYAKAAKQNPDDPEAQVAAAVGRFDEDNLSASFSRLGPLVKRFPKSQVVRYYLGLELVWIGDGTQAIAEFDQAVKLGPKTALGKETARLLARIKGGGSGGGGR